MMRGDQKQAEEFWTFEQFRSVYAVPCGSVVVSREIDRYLPDILIQNSERTLGIEVTRICHAVGERGSVAMASLNKQRKLMARLRDMLVGSNAPSMKVTVHLCRPQKRSRDSREDLATRLAQYILLRVPPVGEVFSKVATRWPIDPHLPPEVFAITVARYRCLTRVTCDAPEALFIPDLREDDLLLPRANKNRRLANYRQWCGEMWLLLCVNTADLATHFSVDVSQLPRRVETSFDRVFVFDVSDRRVFDIQTFSPTPLESNQSPSRPSRSSGGSWRGWMN